MSPPFARVMVPLSLTGTDADLLRYAALLAELGLCTDYLFAHVAPERCRDEVVLDERLRQMEALVAADFGQPARGVRTSFEVGARARTDWLIETAISFQADLTLLGHRKARSGQRSLARQLAMIAPCSVWLVPEGAPAQISRILAPVDFSEHSADSLSVATHIARAAGHDRCLALHVFFDPSTVRYHEHVAEVRENELEAFEEFVAPIDRHGIAVEPLFEESTNVAQSVLRVADRRVANLIVLSTRGRSRAVSILLGSVAAQTMVETRVPVLAVKHGGAKMNLFQFLTDRRTWSRPNPKTN